MRQEVISTIASVLELALYHSLGKLPEPESTHEFF
jgi:PIN domain nuclease of toxin-antitoxin system